MFDVEGGGDLAFAQFDEEGTTTIRFYAGRSLAGNPAIATVEGAASSGIALSGRRVACFTFRGISVADFATAPSVRVVPGSNAAIATDLALSGTTLFLLTSSKLQVWDIALSAMIREVSLEGVPAAVDHRQGEASVVVATSEGLITVQYATGAEPPGTTGTVGGHNRYFKVALTGDRTLHLWDGRDVLSLPLDSMGLPGPGRELRPHEAAIDVAAATARVSRLVRGCTSTAPNGVFPLKRKRRTHGAYLSLSHGEPPRSRQRSSKTQAFRHPAGARNAEGY